MKPFRCDNTHKKENKIKSKQGNRCYPEQKWKGRCMNQRMEENTDGSPKEHTLVEEKREDNI
jgi:hypothetical protein